MQGGICFVQWRMRRWRIIWTHFWKSLSRNIAFFCFPFVFLLTADTSRDEALATSFSDSWLAVIKPWPLVTFGEVLPSITMKFINFLLALFCFLSKEFSPFQNVSCWRNELVSKAWPQLLSVNAVELKWGLCREKSLGSQWIMRIMTPWRFINFYLKISFCR